MRHIRFVRVQIDDVARAVGVATAMEIRLLVAGSIANAMDSGGPDRSRACQVLPAALGPEAQFGRRCAIHAGGRLRGCFVYRVGRTRSKGENVDTLKHGPPCQVCERHRARQDEEFIHIYVQSPSESTCLRTMNAIVDLPLLGTLMDCKRMDPRQVQQRQALSRQVLPWCVESCSSIRKRPRNAQPAVVTRVSCHALELLQNIAIQRRNAHCDGPVISSNLVAVVCCSPFSLIASCPLPRAICRADCNPHIEAAVRVANTCLTTSVEGTPSLRVHLV